MSMSSKYLPLGTPVRILGHVTKTKEIRRRGYQLMSLSSWRTAPAPPTSGHGSPVETGVIVGVRTLSSCDSEITEAEGIQVRRTHHHFQAYLVAASLFRAPVHCALDQVQPLGDEEAAV